MIESVHPVLWVLFWAAFATIGHELAHYVVYLTFAHEIELDLRGMEITATYDDTPRNQDLAIVASLAPAIIFAIVGFYLFINGYGLDLVDGNSWREMVMWVGLGIFGLAGGLSDYRPLIHRLQQKAIQRTLGDQ
jgi:hypothetical protein